MNYTLIVLGVILCVIIYMMFKFISEQGKTVTSIVTLDGTTTNPDVLFSSLSSPTSSRYYLSFWINVVNAPSGINGTDLFKIVNKNNNAIVTVSLTASSELKYSMTEQSPGTTNSHTIMTNFPLQKWVYVILSVDGKTVDLYIDGKMIRSENLGNLPEATTIDCKFVFNNPNSSAVVHMAKFERNPTAVDPSTAWSKYIAGNGGNYFSNLFSSYGATFTLTKDNLDVNKFSLF
jgi:hypothetical protein